MGYVFNPWINNIKAEYESGDILCDMHDGFKYLPGNLKPVQHIKTHMDDSSKVIMAFNRGKHPGNKYLVVIGKDYLSGNLIAAYGYDNRLLGIVVLEMTSHKE